MEDLQLTLIFPHVQQKAGVLSQHEAVLAGDTMIDIDEHLAFLRRLEDEEILGLVLLVGGAPTHPQRGGKRERRRIHLRVAVPFADAFFFTQRRTVQGFLMAIGQ